MTFSKFNSQSIAQYFVLYQKPINLAVIVLLAIYLLAFAADLVWRIIPEPTLSSNNKPQTQPQVSQRGSQSGVDLAKIQQLKLFGDAKAQPVEVVAQPEVTNAPETRLNLTLVGVVTSSNPSYGMAIIAKDSKQTTYGAGNKIEGTNAILQNVYFDRVIIRNGSRHETLMLDGERFSNQPKTARQTAAKPKRQSAKPKLSSEAIDATKRLRSEPSSFLEFIAISPQMKNGKLAGYSVRPGKDKTLFDATELKSGDIVTQINGFDLTDRQQVQEAMTQLRTADSLELSLIRDGQYETVFVEMPSTDQE